MHEIKDDAGFKEAIAGLPLQRVRVLSIPGRVVRHGRRQYQALTEYLNT